MSLVPVPPLPEGLAQPTDDGAARHLLGRTIPHVTLASTDGGGFDVAAFDFLVLYVFPRMSPPGVADLPGWDDIPGARGCTQQSCAFRDLTDAFADLGYKVAGLSAQSSEQQSEASERLHLTFPLLADPKREVGRALGLPTFEIEGMILYKRLTFVARKARIEKVFYPVFPPDENAQEVLDWIRAN
jgi:peroxiredoxin